MNNFIDIFKKSFLSGTTTEISLIGIAIVMVLALIVAFFIYIVYKKCYTGVLYSHNFNVSVAMMSVISAMIVATISSNVLLSLGMVGALSIVRFRTAIKDPIDLIFLFWAVAAGISVGARIYGMIVIGNLCIGLFFFILSKMKNKKKIYLLVINMMDEAYPQANAVLAKFNYILRSKVSKKGHTEMTVEVHLKDQNTQFTDRISEIVGVDSVSIVSYNGDFAQ